MKIPKQLKVGGRIYKVIYPHLFTDSTAVTYVIHDVASQQIRISNIDKHGRARHEQCIEHTFLHEMIHAIDVVYAGGKLQQTEGCEEIVDQLAEGLLQVIKDNRLFIK